MSRKSNCYGVSVPPKSSGAIIWDNTINTKAKKKNVPQLTSKCWVVYDFNKMVQIHGKREYQRREIASLTKIMTCWVVIQLCKEYNLNPKTVQVTVSDVASDIRGTCANLESGDMLSVENLLYGLMLPSGNDAAFALAQHFGKLLFRRKYTRADINKIKSFQFDYHPYYAKYFLKEMNDYAR